MTITTAHTIMTILEPILVDLIPFALLKLLIENHYYTLVFEILMKQERTKKQKIKESQSPPKLPPKERQKEIKERQKEIKITFWRIVGFF
ncbi:hypothetical protein HpBT335_00250 [Helicobacter pylori]